MNYDRKETEYRFPKPAASKFQRKTHLATLLALTAVLLALAFSGCQRGGDAARAEASAKPPVPDGRLQVLATIFPVYDFARAVAGENAAVSMLIAPGASVHSFDPTPADIRRIAGADVFLCIGGESEAWVDTVLDASEKPDRKVLRLIDYVNAVPEEVQTSMTVQEESPENEAADGSEAPEMDEHIWTTPENAQLLVTAIEAALCEADPKNAELYQANAARFRGELVVMDAALTEVCAHATRHTIVVADRYPFLYFSNTYGLDYTAAFPGCHDQADASVQTIAHLIDTVKTEGLPYIYHVELSNARVAKAICEETGAEMLELHSCENVTKKDFENGVTYLDLMLRNLGNLKKGLGTP